MSIQCLKWVVAETSLKGPAKAIAWPLANAARPHPEMGTGTAHVCWPSLRRIGDESGVNERTVRRHLPQLEKAGITIRRQSVPAGQGRCHLYIVPHHPDSLSGSCQGQQADIEEEQPDSQAEQPDSQAEHPDGVSNEPIRTQREPKLLNP